MKNRCWRQFNLYASDILYLEAGTPNPSQLWPLWANHLLATKYHMALTKILQLGLFQFPNSWKKKHVVDDGHPEKVQGAKEHLNSQNFMNIWQLYVKVYGLSNLCTRAKGQCCSSYVAIVQVKLQSNLDSVIGRQSRAFNRVSIQRVLILFTHQVL